MAENKRQRAANEGYDEIDWCEDRATSLSHGPEDERYEITHECRHEEGHAGAHECWLCTSAWHMEVCS